MRELHVDDIKVAVKKLIEQASFELPEAVVSYIESALEAETSERGRSVLSQILENAQLAAKERLALCQDTGLAVLFLELGQDLHITGGSLTEAIDSAVAEAYEEFYLRKSVCHPFTRKNTGNNTPALVYTDIVPGDKLKIRFAAKGGGSENMSRLLMLKPADGREGVIREVVRAVDEAGPNPCPPVIVGVGIGGNFERSAILAKKAAVFRDPGSRNPDAELDELEQEILRRINALGIGPMGLGGNTTALAVHIMMEPCHIASLPLAINLQCHSARHKEIVL